MADRDKGKEKALEPLEGTNIFRFKRKKIENTSDGQKKEGLMERSWQRMQEENRLRKMKMDDEAAAGKKETEAKEDTDEFEEILEGTETESLTEDTVLSTSEELNVCGKEVPVLSTSEEEETILSPKESSTNNPKGIKKKNVVEQAAENNQVSEEEEEMVLISDSLSDTLSDACTGKFPTSPPIDKFMDSDKDKSMRSPPGDDQGSSHRKNL